MLKANEMCTHHHTAEKVNGMQVINTLAAKGPAIMYLIEILFEAV